MEVQGVNVFNYEDHVNYTKWEEQIIYHNDYIILPDGKTVDKTYRVTPNGFDVKNFNMDLVQIWIKNYRDK